MLVIGIILLCIFVFFTGISLGVTIIFALYDADLNEFLNGLEICRTDWLKLYNAIRNSFIKY